MMSVPHLLPSLGLLLHLDPSCAVFEFMDYVVGESSPVTGKNQVSCAVFEFMDYITSKSSPVTGKKTQPSCVVFQFMDYVTSESSPGTGKKWDITGDLTDVISPTRN